MLSALCYRAGSFRRRTFATTHERNVRAWVAIEGDVTLRLDYPLTNTSTVLDVGGYEGQWASDIFKKYGCAIAVFEPWPAFAQQIKARFHNIPAVTVYPFGLGASSRTERLYGHGDSTSVFQRSRRAESRPLPIRALDEVWQELELDSVGLMKINIEGGEYELLDALIETGLVTRVRDVQVQFHRVIPDAKRRRRSLQDRLSATHRLTYSIPFVWENWTLLAPAEG